MIKGALLTFAAFVGIGFLPQTPTHARRSIYPVRYTGWRTEFKSDGIRDNRFTSRLRKRTEKRILRQTRTSDAFPYYAYQETYTVSLVVVTNISRTSLYHHSSGPNENGIYHPFDFYEELQNDVWVATDRSDCGTGVSEHELKSGRSVTFYRGTLPLGVNKGERRKRQWIIFADQPVDASNKVRRTRSLTLLSDSGEQ